MHIIELAEDHPYMAGAIVFGGGLAVLWLLGVFSTGSSTDTGGSNLAAAYYSAEAAQAVAGTQLNLATVQANAAQGIATTQANAAVAINESNNATAEHVTSAQAGAITAMHAVDEQGQVQTAQIQTAGAVQLAAQQGYNAAAIHAQDVVAGEFANAQATFNYFNWLNNPHAVEFSPAPTH